MCNRDHEPAGLCGEERTAHAVFAEHEIAVPVQRHFDAITRTALHAPQPRRRRAGERVEWQFRFIDKIGGRFIGP